jgi:hypothetical protein
MLPIAPRNASNAIYFAILRYVIPRSDIVGVLMAMSASTHWRNAHLYLGMAVGARLCAAMSRGVVTLPRFTIDIAQEFLRPAGDTPKDTPGPFSVPWFDSKRPEKRIGFAQHTQKFYRLDFLF